jgi:hypothetical protein
MHCAWPSASAGARGGLLLPLLASCTVAVPPWDTLPARGVDRAFELCCGDLEGVRSPDALLLPPLRARFSAGGARRNAVARRCEEPHRCDASSGSASTSATLTEAWVRPLRATGLPSRVAGKGCMAEKRPGEARRQSARAALAPVLQGDRAGG